MAQLKSTNITGNLAVTGNILASKIIKLGGTTHEVLLADGTVAKVSTTAQTVAPNAVTATAARTYIVQKNGDQLVVNVPWVKGESSGGTLTEVNLVGGDGITLSANTIGSDSDSITISHKDTSSQASMTTGGRTYVNSIKLDTYGHVTEIGTGVETVVDTGATSVEVTGTGNAVTTASYDADTRKITLNKGSTFLTSHQSLAAYVKGPSTSTDNAIARFDGAGGKTVQNSTATISDNGHLNINTTSDTTMTTPAIHVLHTGPANGSSTADLMILSGYNSAPYGFKFSTYGDGTAIIQSQRISGGNDEKFSLSLNPSGGDVLINGSKAATQAWVKGLGYITGSYLPLAGNTDDTLMTGPIKYGGVTREIISFAPTNATWRGGLKYSWTGNTTIGLWGKHVNSQFVWHAGTDFSTTDVNGTSTRTYDFQVGRDVKSGGSGNLEALLGGKPLATQEWVEGKGYLTSHQSLSGYVTGSDLTADYFILGNGGSSIKKGSYRISEDIESNSTHGYIPTAEAVEDYVRGQISGVGGSDNKTSSSSRANTELKLVGAIDVSENGVETFTNPNCYIGTDNCLYSNGKKVATEDWVEAAIKDKFYSVKIYSEVRYDANGDANNAVWTSGWREDNNNGVWDPSVISGNSTATYTTTGTITSSNQTVTLRRPYSAQSSHSRWVMVVTASGMHGLSISGATATTIENNKYKIQFAAKTPQTITLSKGEATFVIQVQFQTASYQD